jgi:hypothetical protein
MYVSFGKSQLGPTEELDLMELLDTFSLEELDTGSSGFWRQRTEKPTYL